MAGHEISLLDIVSVLAIILGPMLGVFIARLLDSLRDKKARRWDIFSVLMRTRNMRLSFEHVGALNLVEVEFADKKEVIKAWKEYRAELSRKAHAKETPDEIFQKRNNLLTKLLDAIAKTMNLKIEQLDILEGNYIPQGWQDQEDQNAFIKGQLIRVLQGQSAVPIAVMPNMYDQTLFPPAPKPDPETPEE